VERGVRFVQIFANGQSWDNHKDIRKSLTAACEGTDKPVAGLLRDLEQRGLLDSTLVIWGGEFGRTPMAQGSGRDHHIKGFSMWMAGGGVQGGITYGATDELGYNAEENVVHVHDLHATMLHLLGVDHRRLVYKFRGREFRLTDVHGNVVHDVLA
jgi:arylsulfatase A-like enzyme